MQKIKFIILLLLLFFTYKIVNSQEIKQDTIITFYNLEKEAYKSWNNIDSVWHYNTYQNCLINNKLKLSCAKCENIYLDVVFRIDSSGTLYDYKVVNENMCGMKFKPELKVCFLEFFINYIFPAELRNKSIQVRLGTGLKC